jgi:hypothetical protein
LSLAVIAGTSNVLKPAATKAAVVPGLSCSSRAVVGDRPGFHVPRVLWLAIGLVFTFLARETHGKAVPQDAEASAPVALPVATTPSA